MRIVREGYHSANVEITNALAGGNPYLEGEPDEDRTYEDFVNEFLDYAETQSMAGAALVKQHDCDGSFYAVHISSGRTADELAAFETRTTVSGVR